MQDDTLYLPPEWAPQAALWVGWPRLREEWGEAFDAARGEIADVISVAADYLPVRVACGSDEAEASAAAALDGAANVELRRVPTGDIWLRDTGPVITRRGTQAEAQIFRFNGWGGKYQMEGDTETAGALAAVEGIAMRRHDFILEGGAIDVDGEGRLLTTLQCLLNPNRNPGWTERSAETALKAAFGISQVIWLQDGLIGDHTDGHIDNLARFVGPGHVVCHTASGDDDPQADVYTAAETALRAAGLKVTCLPSPGRIRAGSGDDMPASHMNFVLINGAVLLPVYEATHGAEAAAILQDLFPERDVLMLPARAILSGGGSLHCMTREIPNMVGSTMGSPE